MPMAMQMAMLRAMRRLSQSSWNARRRSRRCQNEGIYRSAAKITGEASASSGDDHHLPMNARSFCAIFDFWSMSVGAVKVSD
jgi:hypothetical protein